MTLRANTDAVESRCNRINELHEPICIACAGAVRVRAEADAWSQALSNAAEEAQEAQQSHEPVESTLAERKIQLDAGIFRVTHNPNIMMSQSLLNY